MGAGIIDFNEPMELPSTGFRDLDPRERYNDSFGINAGLRYHQFNNNESTATPTWVTNELESFEIDYTHPQSGDIVNLNEDGGEGASVRTSLGTRFVTYFPRISETANPVYGIVGTCNDSGCGTVSYEDEVYTPNTFSEDFECVNCYHDKYYGEYRSNTKVSDLIPAHNHWNDVQNEISPLNPWPFFCEPFNEVWSDMISAQVGVRTQYFGQFRIGDNLDNGRESDIMTWPGIQMWNTGFCEYCSSNVSATDNCIQDCTPLNECEDDVIKEGHYYGSDEAITSEQCERRCDYVDSEGNCGRSGDWK